MKFRNHYNHKELGTTVEEVDKTKAKKYDPSGYLSREKRIQNMINAGVRLDNYRTGTYDFEYQKNPKTGKMELKVPDDYTDNTRSRDIVDVTDIDNLQKRADTATQAYREAVEQAIEAAKVKKSMDGTKTPEKSQDEPSEDTQKD
jgi:hypothetical protein